MLNVTTATTAELVAFYNATAETPVKKFADRKTAERRVAALIATLPAPAPVAVKSTKTKAPKVYKTAEERSDAIARSWLVPATKTKRLTRHGVTVEGQGTFRSLRQAFAVLGLPMGQHIRFRQQLKSIGEGTFNGYDFILGCDVEDEAIAA